LKRFSRIWRDEKCLKQEKVVSWNGYKKEIEEFYNTYKSNDLEFIKCRQMRQDLNRWMLRIR